MRVSVSVFVGVSAGVVVVESVLLADCDGVTVSVWVDVLEGNPGSAMATPAIVARASNSKTDLNTISCSVCTKTTAK